MQDNALNLVRRLLNHRLRAAGIPASNPDQFYQLEAGDPVANPGGAQIRVKTWRQWSEAQVKLDGDSGELLAYSVDCWAEPRSRTELTEEQALELAARSIHIPQEARLSGFRMFEQNPGGLLAELKWEHYHLGLRVDGDRIEILLHPGTGRIVKLRRFWREVPSVAR